YYQQVGRAGRGVDSAEVVLLPGSEDEAVWAYFDSVGFPSETQVRTALHALNETPISTAELETHVDLSRSRLEAMLKVLDVDGAAKRVRGGWVATGEPWVYDADRYERVAQVRRDEQQAMRDYLATDRCRLRFLREALDDPEAADCGRCDNCGALHLPLEVGGGAVEAAVERLAVPGVPFDPRRMWPSAMRNLGVDLRGKIPPGEQAEAGRAVARMTDLGFGPAVRAALGTGVPDAPVSDALVQAAVKVLAAWGWQQRPSCVVAVGSHRRPQLIGSLAARLAGLGRLEDLGVVPHRGASAEGRSNSALRLRDVWNAYPLPDDIAAAVDGRSVLLVDDLTDSGWTLTVVARQLRQAGAAAVYPLVLGIAG
ncbi:MAG: RecQ family zinc-binding domain-containing protein, partial [Jatrophihabitans sp.]|uniref:RecQ family zinc-binding domain-containing protein n=1 Tax=Jatrophihabitans sp. TaxID=1932789 RepID=UPI003F7DBAA0